MCLYRELQELIDSTSDVASPFHISHAAPSTDTPVYPAPAAPELDSKKRKLDSGVSVNGVSSGHGNSLQHAKHPGLMTSNKHTSAVHDQLKRECEILADLCVSPVFEVVSPRNPQRVTGQGQVMD